MADNKSREFINEMTMKLSLDVSEALTGLKAVQREAKEAAKALKELEQIHQSKPEVTPELQHHLYVNFGLTPNDVAVKSQEDVKKLADFIYRKINKETKAYYRA